MENNNTASTVRKVSVPDAEGFWVYHREGDPFPPIDPRKAGWTPIGVFYVPAGALSDPGGFKIDNLSGGDLDLLGEGVWWYGPFSIDHVDRSAS